MSVLVALEVVRIIAVYTIVGFAMFLFCWLAIELLDALVGRVRR